SSNVPRPAPSAGHSRFGADGGLEAERRLLVEEQKLCKTRARKFSLETRRRRKALEERRRQWDVREQRQRENILQQRRQRVQDATERFQRAHLPPSQRRRRCQSRNVPNIEEALSQIQSKEAGNNPITITIHTVDFFFSFVALSNGCRGCTFYLLFFCFPPEKLHSLSQASHYF
uniref:Uncharacterized protein n=1 Tax=Scophthalmus maximus TaxID=52904 RepID=A0A8D3DVD2_SCOMX